MVRSRNRYIQHMLIVSIPWFNLTHSVVTKNTSSENHCWCNYQKKVLHSARVPWKVVNIYPVKVKAKFLSKSKNTDISFNKRSQQSTINHSSHVSKTKSQPKNCTWVIWCNVHNVYLQFKKKKSRVCFLFSSIAPLNHSPRSDPMFMPKNCRLWSGRITFLDIVEIHL